MSTSKQLSPPGSPYEESSLDSGPTPQNPWSTTPLPTSGESGSGPSSSFTGNPVGSTSQARPDLPRSSSTASTSGFNTDGSQIPSVLGVAVVDFNHLVGPTVEYAFPPSLQDALNDDDESNRLSPFLALPDGAHLSEEDYSYFHCTYSPSSPERAVDSVPSHQTSFGISCNRQLASADSSTRPSDVTRSTVQKAVIVIASQPVFGPIRDRLGVVTRAFFAQRDFTQTDIIDDFYHSLESSSEGKSGEGAIYMGTSLRELVHKFRHKTLVMLKMLMLQKRLMSFGYPVEMLCTYQYSSVSLMPGSLMNSRDCGAPELDLKPPRTRPTSFRSSDRSSSLRYMGLPLHLFGADAFFQPYSPSQQVDTLRTKSWLTGTTNQIVTQQRDCKFDLLVNIENVSFTFSDPKIERLVASTAEDRRWMDDVVRTVEETWDVDEGSRTGFRGSDDDSRQRFEEYICAALASIKFADFLAKGSADGVTIIGVSGEGGVLQSFSEAWLDAFKATPAFERWNTCTDPALFDICEPKHPCNGKVNVVSDLGLRLAEGFHDLHIDQSLAPTRDALSSAYQVGSSAIVSGGSSLFKAFDGVRSDISARIEAERQKREKERQDRPPQATGPGNEATTASAVPAGVAEIGKTLGGIGAGIGGFFGSKYASLRGAKEEPKGLRPMNLSPSKR